MENFQVDRIRNISNDEKLRDCFEFHGRGSGSIYWIEIEPFQQFHKIK